MDYFPLFADLRDRPCLVVGGGRVAERKVRLLRAARARVKVVAPQLTEALAAAAEAGDIDVERTLFAPPHIADHVIIVAATNDAECNARVAAAARAAGRLCNVADDPEHCGFILPAIVERGPVTIAVSTGGRSPTLARWLKARLERLIPARVGELAVFGRRWRDAVARRFAHTRERQRFWLDVFDGPMVEDVLAGRGDKAERAMTRALARSSAGGAAGGEAYLVGAGPGDADLISLRGARLLGRADVVLHDSLVSRSVLELARRDATLVNVGKRAGRHSMKQAQISRLLVRLVAAGRRVCRLKGGDPFVFGRGAEEALALKAAGLAFQIVPGVTAASACGAYAGIPLTHRGLADSVTFVTAHGCQPGAEPDWRSLSGENRTIVFYMGSRRLRQIGQGLVRHGRDPDTPVAIVQNGSTREQRTRFATLAALASGSIDRSDRSSDRSSDRAASPATVIVGEVVTLAGQLAWFEPASSVSALMAPGPNPAARPIAVP